MSSRHAPENIRFTSLMQRLYSRKLWILWVIKHYSVGRELKKANPQTFRSLNNTYVTDGVNVWAIGGRIIGADAETFQVCDDGRCSSDRCHFPYGYAKDKNHVYYDNNSGVTKIVKKADPASFFSLGDAYFGRDNHFIFCGAYTIAKADHKTWRKLEGHYSMDKNHVFYFSQKIIGADLATFRVVACMGVGGSIEKSIFAEDAFRKYQCGNVIDAFSDHVFPHL
jgi:hypothetical protein